MKSIVIAAGLLLSTAGLAHAEGPTTVVGDPPYTERVAYEPAALAGAEGIQNLRSRVRRAAHRVCDLGLDSYSAEYRERVCYQATLPEALAQVDRAAASWAAGEQPKVRLIVVAAR